MGSPSKGLHLGPFKGIYRAILGLYRGCINHIGIMEKKMETTIQGLGFKV